MLYLVTDLRAMVSALGRRYEPQDSQFHLTTLNSMKELNEMEKSLRSEDDREQMVSIMPATYIKWFSFFKQVERCRHLFLNLLLEVSFEKNRGADLEETVKNVMKR